MMPEKNGNHCFVYIHPVKFFTKYRAPKSDTIALFAHRGATSDNTFYTLAYNINIHQNEKCVSNCSVTLVQPCIS